MEQTKKCPICGNPYKIYAYSAADQSACPYCVNKAESRMRGNNRLIYEQQVKATGRDECICQSCLKSVGYDIAKKCAASKST